ncbi:MAG: hypothetical protein ACIALR_14800 [Blastopirellula sp. JB062]
MNIDRMRCGWAVAAVLCLVGCSQSGDSFDRADVKGVVLLDGEPLEQGSIYFVPIQGTSGPKSFAAITNGEFSAEGEHGPLVGSHRVEVRSTDDGGIAADDEEAKIQWISEGRKPPKRVVVPPIYNKRSVLTADVVADGPNEFKFELSTKRRR